MVRETPYFWEFRCIVIVCFASFDAIFGNYCFQHLAFDDVTSLCGSVSGLSKCAIDFACIVYPFAKMAVSDAEWNSKASVRSSLR
jgi:hypothetical protein